MGEAVAILFFIFGAVAIFVVTARALGMATLEQLRSRNDVFQRLADTFGGQCTEGTYFQLPVVTFPHAGRIAEIRIVQTNVSNHPRSVQFATAWPDPVLDMEVYTNRGLVRLIPSRNRVLLKTPRFDGRYLPVAGAPRPR